MKRVMISMDKKIADSVSLVFICFATVGLAALFGSSEHAGLFGATIGTGLFLINRK